jgi:hypothetical protein
MYNVHEYSIVDPRQDSEAHVRTTKLMILLSMLQVLGATALMAQDVGRVLQSSHMPFRNLQVLDPGVTAVELAETMEEIKNAIGSERGCLFCHVGESRTPLSTWDFASDAKVEKQVARRMLRMVEAMNSEYLNQLPGRDTPARVTCRTCHDARPRPIPLEDLLLEVFRNQGLPAMEERYRALRERYYGGPAYDFREHVLRHVADGLEASETDARLAILALNLEFNPDSWRTFIDLGELWLSQGEPEAAEVQFLKSLEIRLTSVALDGLRRARGG